MKSTCTLLVTTLLSLSLLVLDNVSGQTPQAAAPTDLYHIHFAKSALGKAAQQGDYLKTQDSKAPMPGHYLVLRHQYGESWDYAVIEHLGTKATVTAAGSPPAPAARDLGEWHDDTFVNGPPWTEFARAMGIGETAKGSTSGSVYVVSVYRAAPGHRDQLEKNLNEPPAAGDPQSGRVVMRHLEGGPWQYLQISRYNSWQDFATNESNSQARSLKGEGNWFKLRDHAAYHTDTLTYRIAP